MSTAGVFGSAARSNEEAKQAVNIDADAEYKKFMFFLTVLPEATTPKANTVCRAGIAQTPQFRIRPAPLQPSGCGVQWLDYDRA